MHSATMHFLKHTTMPAIILEPLFIDNDEDCRPLLSVKGRRSLAVAIAEGINLTAKEMAHA